MLARWDRLVSREELHRDQGEIMLNANAGTEMYMWTETDEDGEMRMMSHRDGETHTTGWEDAETVREQFPLIVKIATLSGVTVHETMPDGYGETGSPFECRCEMCSGSVLPEPSEPVMYESVGTWQNAGGSFHVPTSSARLSFNGFVSALAADGFKMIGYTISAGGHEVINGRPVDTLTVRSVIEFVVDYMQLEDVATFTVQDTYGDRGTFEFVKTVRETGLRSGSYMVNESLRRLI